VTNDSKKARTEILNRLLDQSLELVSVVKEASRNILLPIFLFHKAAKKLNSTRACTEFNSSSKNIHLVAQSF
jgi:hypothetical protein